MNSAQRISVFQSLISRNRDQINRLHRDVFNNQMLLKCLTNKSRYLCNVIQKDKSTIVKLVVIQKVLKKSLFMLINNSSSSSNPLNCCVPISDCDEGYDDEEYYYVA